ASLLRAGAATGIGSLPHQDARAAAALVLRCLPELPAAPELPARSPHEAMLPRWLGAVPEIEVLRDATIRVRTEMCDEPVVAVLDEEAHGGVLAFLDLAASAPIVPGRIKVQVAGPLTLGIALHHAGIPHGHAFVRAVEASRTWARALECEVRRR